MSSAKIWVILSRGRWVKATTRSDCPPIGVRPRFSLWCHWPSIAVFTAAHCTPYYAHCLVGLCFLMVPSYCQTSNISNTKSEKVMFLISSCICLCQIHWSQVLTHWGREDLWKWAILTPYWHHQSLGYLKKIWMPVVNIHWCPWTLKGFNI